MRQLLGHALNYVIYARRHLKLADPLRALSHSLSDTFSDVETFLLFVGAPRSGHTLVMALLDAHPEVLLANELNLFGHLNFTTSRNFLFSLLVDNSRQWVRDGATWQGYSYAVPNQWQGRWKTIRVIGNKDAGVTTRSVRHDLDALDKMQEVARARLRIIHVLRNPYDNISTMNRQNDLHDVERDIERYHKITRINEEVLNKYDGTDVIYTLRHESIIDNPEQELRALCEFVGVEPTPDYLKDCVSIVYKSPNKSRHKTQWHDDALAQTQDLIRTYPFLSGYTFDD